MEARQEVRLKEQSGQPTKKHGSRDTHSLNQPRALSATAVKKSRPNRLNPGNRGK